MVLDRTPNTKIYIWTRGGGKYDVETHSGGIESVWYPQTGDELLSTIQTYIEREVFEKKPEWADLEKIPKSRVAGVDTNGNVYLKKE